MTSWTESTSTPTAAEVPPAEDSSSVAGTSADAGPGVEIAREQVVVSERYDRLDELRAELRRRLERVRRSRQGVTPQNRSERDSFATMYEDRLGQLDSVEDKLVFGRLDLADGSRRYVGRIGLTDSEHSSILTDWRAPAARPFYRATAAHPEGVVRRRHIATRSRRVTGLEDELLDLDALEPAAPGGDGSPRRASVAGLGHLAGEGALLAALAQGRTGRMGDIVATMQAEQDEIVRADLSGALVVQGGPGTGKTAVALHRAAYLLYAHRRMLERSGVLLVGPSRTFLRYIDQVLPSLGETGVVTATIADLVPGVEATAVEDDEVARIKGLSLWRGLLARAVAARQRVPAREVRARIDGITVVVRPRAVADAIARARRTNRPHNRARVSFVRDMLGRLADQYVEQLSFDPAHEDRAEILEDLRSDRDVRVALNLAWMPLTPQGVLSDLYAKPHRLAEVGTRLSPAERALLERPKDAPWTAADVPLLDELAELLGEDDQAARAQARADAARHAQEVEYARGVLASSGAGGGLVSAEQLAERFTASGPRLTTAERAAMDRTWTYGHVVVDEAQELSAMDWRMLVRRVPTRSMTIVGDVAQTSSRAGARSWHSALDPVLRSSWTLAQLTVSYRTPAEVVAAAQAMAHAAKLPTSPLTSARSVPGSLVLEHVEAEAGDGSRARLSSIVSAARKALADVGSGEAGRAACIVPIERLAEVSAALLDAGLTRARASLDDPLVVLDARASKGLEFDVVVLVDPASIRAGGAGDLYVAMTRPTTRLDVVHTGALPAGLRPAT